MLNFFIRFFLENKLVAYLLLLLFIGWGLATAPFDFGIKNLPRDPVAVDAIPDIGENQQIVFTKWPGRSPQDVEDQITYPLTTALLGVPGVKSIRSNSMFGFSGVYVIFDDDTEFYWSRSRILEKLNSLPAGTLPEGVQPTLGPDATALGQIFWYTLEGRDAEGNPTGGWDLQELRSIQDFYVRYGLTAAEGVSEVASIGGFVKEYQVDVDPAAMKAYNIGLAEIMQAVKNSNRDIGAQTIEINRAEYFVRGLGYVKNITDLEQSVVKTTDNVPVRLGDVAKISIGPATRRGVLDKSGAEAVGGVVVARYGANPLSVIENVKEKIDLLAPGLPVKTLADGTVSQVTVVPFYDRTLLINETVGTLQEALSLEVLITVLVVILMLLNLKSSLLVSGTLPVAVLMCFIAMKYFGVNANIVALSGIAIAIGTMVDMGIVLTESMVNRIDEAPPEENLLQSIYLATTEVAGAVITAVATTVVSFLPVFTMEAAEGKLFKPLAYTKTFALVASIIVAITIIPPLAHTLFSFKSNKKIVALIGNAAAILAGICVAIFFNPFLGAVLALIGAAGVVNLYLQKMQNPRYVNVFSLLTNIVYALLVAWLLAGIWMPLGVNKSSLTNFLFILTVAGGLIGFFWLVIYFYENILRFLLRFKILFLLLVGFIIFQGFLTFQKIGQEFMPALDEGSFLLMPTSMPHAGMQENIKNLRLLDMAVTAIPEVETVVGKAGRVNSALDPAPMSMYENVIQYKTEYKTDADGRRLRFRYKNGAYERDDAGNLIPDDDGRYFRQWRDEIKSPDDIWQEIVRVTKLPGVTSAPKLQPIETRLVMLQTGMRAPMGIKISGSDLVTMEAFGLELEKLLTEVEGVKAAAVFADRIVGKPYLLLDIDRAAVSRYGLTVGAVQNHIQAAVGGMAMTTTVEGRERYAVRLRYPRELRNDPAALREILIATPAGQQIPLGDLIEIDYEQGAQSIKSEDGFLVSYVLFDREAGYSEVGTVNAAQDYLQQKIDAGELTVPAGISYRFAGNYEQQVRANRRLGLVVPIALGIIFLILYFQFRSIAVSLMVFSGVFVAFAGGFIMLGLYDTTWFLNFDFFGTNMRDLFQIGTVNLSVAVWVGFLALFGIATDDGVLVATFLQDSFKKNEPTTLPEIRAAVVEGGLRRVRPAMMTTATTILALLPVLTSTGRGADIMLPMAIPSFGGMTLQVITMFTVPVLFALWKENRMRFKKFINKKSATAVLLLCFLTIGNNAANAQSLDSLRAVALRENQTLQALDYEYRAAAEREAQVTQLPDPEVGIGYFPLPVETRLGAQTLRVSVMQMFPWFGTLERRAAVENAKAKADYERIETQISELDFMLRNAWVNLYEIEASRRIIARNLDLLTALERLALAKTETGAGSAADVLRAQMQREVLEQKLLILENKRVIPQAEINQLLHRPVDTPVTITDSLAFAELPFEPEFLYGQIDENHPALRRFELQQEIARQNIELNRLAARPDFGVGADYIAVNDRSDMLPEGNGRDIVQLKATVKVPLFKQKYAAKEREENLKIAALAGRREETFTKFKTEIRQAYAAHETARLQAELYDRQSELTRAAVRILQADYSARSGRFDELLRLEKDLIDFELGRLEAVTVSWLARNRVLRYVNFGQD